MGQNDQFPSPNLSAGCGFSKETLAGARGNDEVAPIPADRLTTIGRLKSTQLRNWPREFGRPLPDPTTDLTTLSALAKESGRPLTQSRRHEDAEDRRPWRSEPHSARAPTAD
jgi:hypothetical protein